MFNYMIVINDNGELKSVTAGELEQSVTTDGGPSPIQMAVSFTANLEILLNRILDERSAREADELGRFGVKTEPRK